MSIRRFQRGVTLIELIVFIVIISVGVAGILGVMSLTTSLSSDPLRRKQALMIAESLMEEAQMASFALCDATSPNADVAATMAECVIPDSWGRVAPEPAGARPFDHINDYVTAAGALNAAAFSNAGVLEDASGTPFAATGYSASLSVTPATLGTCGPPANAGCIGTAGASEDTEVLRLTVTVTYEGGDVVLDSYRTRYAPR